MPLTPAEVHNVAFKKPPIGKRGYDEEEVDAFLDIVEVELARLIEENNDLRGRLQSGQPAPEQGAEGGGVDPAELTAVQEENGRLHSRIQELEQSLAQAGSAEPVEHAGGHETVTRRSGLRRARRAAAASGRDRAAAQREPRAARAGAGRSWPRRRPARPRLRRQPRPRPAATRRPITTCRPCRCSPWPSRRPTSTWPSPRPRPSGWCPRPQAQAHATIEDANQRSTQQISDAETRAQQLDEESSARAQQTISDAEQRAATITAQFEQRKAALERRVEELRTFEREYRTRLKSYLESQLRDLDASGKSEPASNTSDYAEAQ